MKMRLILNWNRLRESFWFIPSIFSFLAILMAIAAPILDKHYINDTSGLLRLFAEVNVAGARALLGVIISSSMTVAGVVFSVIIAVLANASSQFGPGLLPRFMRLKTTKLTLGIFLACFIYAIGVFPQLGDFLAMPNKAPLVSVYFSVFLSVFSFFVLIHFIHSITHFLQPLNIIDNVSAELLQSLCQAYPAINDSLDEKTTVGQLKTITEKFNQTNIKILPSPCHGYLQAIAFEKLEVVMRQYGMTVDLCSAPGAFIVEGQAVARFIADNVNEDLISDLQSVFIMDKTRDSLQDPGFVMEQLVEIAIRALSPGINAPFLALQCLDHLLVALMFVADRMQPVKVKKVDDNYWVRNWYCYDRLCNDAFNLLRQYGENCTEVMLRINEIIISINDKNIPADYRKALTVQAGLIQERIQMTMS